MQVKGDSSLNKLILLFVFDKMEVPLSENTVLDMCCSSNNWLAYMDCQPILNQLLECGWIYNIGNSSPESLLDFVKILSEELVRAKVLPADYDFDAHKKLVPMQAGDVAITYADISPLARDFHFKPATTLREGLRRFAEWYHDFYQKS